MDHAGPLSQPPPTGAPRAPRPLRTVFVALAGILLAALAAFAATNVGLLEQWGADIAETFRGGLSLPVTLVFVFLAGVLTSLTPCVYPVIPLAVTYLGARGATSRLQALSLAGAYVGGMVACYTALGAAAGLTGTTFGAATQKWWVYAGVATIVVAFGLSMLGLFTIALPSSLQSLIGRRRGAGYGGAVLMGATSGLVTAPCTAPVLGALILPMISGQSVALGSLLLAVFGLGMGMLFLVVGTYSGVLSRLPRSGRWMNLVKIALGLAILGVAAYFYYQAWEILPWRGGDVSTATAASGLDGPRAASPIGLTLASVAPLAASSRPESDAPEPQVPKATQGGGAKGRSTAPPGDAPPPGRQAPAFTIMDLAGRRLDLAGYRGQTLHLVFFALWCPPCLEQMDRVAMADARLRGRGYRALLVGVRERQDEEALRRHAEAQNLGLPVAWDRDGEVAKAFGISSIPAHVIVGDDGRIRFEGREPPQGFERDGAGLLRE